MLSTIVGTLQDLSVVRNWACATGPLLGWPNTEADDLKEVKCGLYSTVLYGNSPASGCFAQFNSDVV